MKKWKLSSLFVFVFAIFACFAFVGCGANAHNGTMTQSYETARGQYKLVTGIDLPELSNVDVDPGCFENFDESSVGYALDIVGGDACTFETYTILENFFHTLLGNYAEGFPTGDETEGRTAEWETEDRWYQLVWYVNENDCAIFVNTNAIQ